MNSQEQQTMRVVNAFTALFHLENEAKQVREEIYCELVKLYDVIRNPKVFDNFCQILRIPSAMKFRLYEELQSRRNIETAEETIRAFRVEE